MPISRPLTLESESGEREPFHQSRATRSDLPGGRSTSADLNRAKLSSANCAPANSRTNQPSTSLKGRLTGLVTPETRNHAVARHAFDSCWKWTRRVVEQEISRGSAQRADESPGLSSSNRRHHDMGVDDRHGDDGFAENPAALPPALLKLSRRTPDVDRRGQLINQTGDDVFRVAVRNGILSFVGREVRASRFASRQPPDDPVAQLDEARCAGPKPRCLFGHLRRLWQQPLCGNLAAEIREIRSSARIDFLSAQG